MCEQGASHPQSLMTLLDNPRALKHRCCYKLAGFQTKTTMSLRKCWEKLPCQLETDPGLVDHNLRVVDGLLGFANCVSVSLRGSCFPKEAVDLYPSNILQCLDNCNQEQLECMQALEPIHSNLWVCSCLHNVSSKCRLGYIYRCTHLFLHLSV